MLKNSIIDKLILKTATLNIPKNVDIHYLYFSQKNTNNENFD